MDTTTGRGAPVALGWFREDGGMNSEALFGVIVAAALGFVALVAWLVYELRQGAVESPLALIGTWIALSGVTIGFILVGAFVLDHLLLFILGTTAAGIGLVLTGVAVFVTPIVWALIIRRRAPPQGAAAH